MPPTLKNAPPPSHRRELGPVSRSHPPRNRVDFIFFDEETTTLFSRHPCASLVLYMCVLQSAYPSPLTPFYLRRDHLFRSIAEYTRYPKNFSSLTPILGSLSSVPSVFLNQFFFNYKWMKLREGFFRLFFKKSLFFSWKKDFCVYLN